VLIADDEQLVRDALADSIGSSSSCEVVGTASRGEEAIRLAGLVLPDVALVDVNMPGGGKKAVRGILACSPQTRVVVLSGSEDRATVLAVLRAGAAGYVVKSDGPNGIVDAIVRSARGESILSPEITGGVLDELALQLEHRELGESEARQAVERVRRVLDERRFETVFQPIIDLADGRSVGFEALTRFPGSSLQGPEVWFADAGAVGLRIELELATAAEAVRRFGQRLPGAFLALNFSPTTLPYCRGVLQQLGGQQIVVEITEHAAIDDYEALAPSLDALRADGVLLAVDDAGAGFASLRHALHLSPDIIKLDVSLTRGIDGDRRRHALATGLIGFAKELGASIVAEGIETTAELETLRELGVSCGQGFYLARPGPLPPAGVTR
jgi:EAL domain-containing protein (putative c-di-GMP-specific phosphodiesterase class I)/CheY-like chemotaxis protein